MSDKSLEYQQQLHALAVRWIEDADLTNKSASETIDVIADLSQASVSFAGVCMYISNVVMAKMFKAHGETFDWDKMLDESIAVVEDDIRKIFKLYREGGTEADFAKIWGQITRRNQ